MDQRTLPVAFFPRVMSIFCVVAGSEVAGKGKKGVVFVRSSLAQAVSRFTDETDCGVLVVSAWS